MQDVISEEELDDIFNKIAEGYDDEEVHTTLRPIRAYDFKNPIYLSEDIMVRMYEKMEIIALYFQRDFYKLTGIDINCSVMMEEGQEAYYFTGDLDTFKKSLINPSYTREYRIDDKQLFINLNPDLIDKILIGRNENSSITLVTKRLANQYFFNLLKELLSNFSATPITEYEQTYTTSPSFIQVPQTDNIIENSKYLISNRNSNVSTFSIKFKVELENIVSFISFEFDWEACYNFIGYPRTPFYIKDQKYYDENNIAAIIGRFNLNDKDVQNLEEGSILKTSTFMGEPLSVVVDNQIYALGEAIQIDYSYGVRIVEVFDEDKRINLDNPEYNTFIIFGDTMKSQKEIDNVGEGTIIEFCRQVGYSALLVHNNKIIAIGDIEIFSEWFTFKVTKIINEPLYYKSSKQH